MIQGKSHLGKPNQGNWCIVSPSKQPRRSCLSVTWRMGSQAWLRLENSFPRKWHGRIVCGIQHSPIYMYIHLFTSFQTEVCHAQTCAAQLLAWYLQWHFLWCTLPTLKFIPKNTMDTLNQATQTIRDLFRTFVVLNRVSTVPSFFTFTNDMKICLSAYLAVAKTTQINLWK